MAHTATALSTTLGPMNAQRQTERRLTAAAWMATTIYFPLQLIVAQAWPQPYSFAANTISDLGVTSCGMVQHIPGHDIVVCSPRHVLMNIGFVCFGVLTITGAVLMWRTVPRTRLMAAALAGVILAGIGGVLVGLAPSDVAPWLHRAGALLRLPGVVAPVLVAMVLWPRRPRLAAFCVGSAAAGVLGLALFAMRLSPHWVGAAERLALDPFTVWTAVLGLCLAARPIEDDAGPAGPPER